MKILEKEGKEARFGQIEWNNTFVLSPMIDSSYQTLKRDYKINLSPSIYQKKIGFIGVTRGWKFEVFIGGAGKRTALQAPASCPPCRGGKSPNPAAGTPWNSQHSPAGPRHPGIVAGAQAEKDGIAVVPRRSEPTRLPSPPSISFSLLPRGYRRCVVHSRILSILWAEEGRIINCNCYF